MLDQASSTPDVLGIHSICFSIIGVDNITWSLWLVGVLVEKEAFKVSWRPAKSGSRSSPYLGATATTRVVG